MVTVKNNIIKEDDYRSLKLRGINSDIFISSTVAYNFVQRLIDEGHIVGNMHSDKMFSSIVSSRNVYGFTTKVKSDKRVKSNPEGMDDPVKLYASRGNEYYVDRKNIEKGIEAIDCYKVYTPFANNIGTDLSDDNINTIIGKPGTIATETYLVIGSNVNLNEKTAGNISRYMKTKFVRFLISLAKANQNGTQKTYAFVPMQDFSSSSEINWNSNNLDEQLYKKYNCSKAEIDYIMTNIADLK